MRLVVGLGNPGERYAATRHNVGWRVLDELARRWRAGPERVSERSATRRARTGEHEVALIRPLTFMNAAGDALRGRADDVERDELLVISDDVYLPVGTVRLRSRGSTGGHRGLESIASALGSTNFARLRIGVGAAESSERLREHVLESFGPEEASQLEEAVSRAADAVECWVAEGISVAMNQFNRRVRKEASES